MSDSVGTLDCSAFYGRPAVPAGDPYLSPGAMLAEMDRLGIAERWCADFRAIENSPALGNRLLCEELAGHPRLHPVWVVLPAGTGELPPPGELLAAMARDGVQMVRAEPAGHGYSLAEWCCGDLWTALESARVPVLLDAADDWENLAAMLAAHRELPVVLTNVTYRSDRVLYPLLERHPNLHLEISGYLVNEGLLELVRRFGASRALFGTDSPRVAPEEAVGTLNFAGLSGEDRGLVAGGNLRRLLGAAGAGLRGRGS